MRSALVQDFTCETIEGHDRYVEVVINCRVIVDAFGIKIDSVQQSNIREAVRRAVEDAVTVEATAKKESRDEH